MRLGSRRPPWCTRDGKAKRGCAAGRHSGSSPGRARKEVVILTTYTDQQVVETLLTEGYTPEDVDAAIDSMITAGLVLEQPDEGYLFTAGELDLLRKQLSS